MEYSLPVPNGYRLERLDTSAHSREGFSCGNPPLDEYLKTQAAQAQGKYCAATSVLVEVGEADGVRPIAGYVTLLNFEIPLSECPDWVLKKITKKPSLPGLLLARMAVDTRHQGKHLGEFLLMKSMVTALNISRMSGCFALVVDAKGDDSRNFYMKYGFSQMKDSPYRLFLPTITIEPLFAL